MLAGLELRRMLPEPRPAAWWMVGGVGAILLANWAGPVLGLPASWPSLVAVTLMAVGMLLVGFLVEMGRFRVPGEASHRLAQGALAFVWLGLAPSFLVQLRWFGQSAGSSANWWEDAGLWALAYGIFVPKVGDIAAYFAGSLVGRHRLAPVLSPKKTWEGAIGGLIGSVGAGWAIVAWGGHFTGQWSANGLWTVLASLLVGVVAQLSDLAESLVKRDCQVKDSTTYLPGLGGILDTMDSLLWSGPVTWLVWHTRIALG
jgi:phosphatidate cytidylyltransferase